MKVAYLISTLHPSAMLTVVLNLAEQMQGRDENKCEVWYFDRAKHDDKAFPVLQERLRICEAKGIIFRRIGFWSCFFLFLINRVSDTDIIHTHGFRANVYAKIFSIFSHKRKGIKLITTQHSYIGEEFYFRSGRVLGRLFTRMFMYSISGHDYVVAQSHDMAEYYSSWIKREKLRVIPNGVRPFFYSGRQRKESYLGLDIASLNKNIKIIADLVPIKGLEVLLKAVALLPDEYTLAVYGGDNEAESLKLDSLCTKLRIKGRICWAGYVENVSQRLTKGDVYVQSSYSEGFCLSMVEAAMAGCTIVCSDIRGMRERFSDDEVFYYPVNDFTVLAECIKLAVDDKERGLKVQRKAREHFTSERMAEDYFCLYGGVNGVQS